MNRLTISEITTLARLSIQDALLNMFRTRLLIAYTVGLGFIKGSMINGNHIENGWLVLKKEAEDEIWNLLTKDSARYIPLHPIILKIFEKYNNNIPTFNPEEIGTFLKKLAIEMCNNSHQQFSEQVWNRRLDTTFRSPTSGLKDMQAEGISVPESLLLTGLGTNHTYPVIGPEIEELFFDPFYYHLIPLAAQHGIDSAKVLGI